MDITTPDGRREYIITTWPTIAAYAYTGFKKYGPGALVIECTPTEPTDTMQFWHGEAAEEAGIGEQISAYNPEQEILVVFSFPNENKFARFKLDDEELTPPLMAAQAPAAEELWQDA
jgi:hypothetical protein